jgi:hypothetical protein
VTTTKASGVTTQYEVDSPPSGGRHETNTLPDGTVIQKTFSTDGTNSQTSADGTTLTDVQTPDPRFSMQAPVIGSKVVQTPGGLKSTITTTRQLTLGDPTNILSLVSQTDTVSVNGDVYTIVYTSDTRTISTVTPMGRRSVASQTI